MRNLLIILLILLSVPTFASSALHAEFVASFHSGYVRGRCAENIRNLILRLRAQGVDLSRARVAVITNGGYHFSVTHRRNSGDRLQNPQGEIKFAPGIAKFSFHVILENEGKVYDYDFGNAPQVTSIKQYIKTMFWDEPQVTQYTGLETLAQRRDYKIAFVPAEKFLELRNTGEAPLLDLSDFYDGLPAAFTYSIQ